MHLSWYMSPHADLRKTLKFTGRIPKREMTKADPSQKRFTHVEQSSSSADFHFRTAQMNRLPVALFEKICATQKLAASRSHLRRQSGRSPVRSAFVWRDLYVTCAAPPPESSRATERTVGWRSLSFATKTATCLRQFKPSKTLSLMTNPLTVVRQAIVAASVRSSRTVFTWRLHHSGGEMTNVGRQCCTSKIGWRPKPSLTMLLLKTRRGKV